jgi:hypothetical protein
MNHRVFRNLLAGLGVCILAIGCAFQTPAPAPVPAVVAPPAPPPKPTALSQEAEDALAAAEQKVIEARVKRSLWIPAVEHLNKARAAAKRFDSDATMLHAKEAIALCILSIAQLDSPPVRW